MFLKKRNCGIEIKLVPYGGGWTDVYLNTRDHQLYFIISDVMGRQFSNLLRALYFIHPNQKDPDDAGDIIESKNAAFDMETQKITKVYEKDEEYPVPGVYRHIPYRAEFTWDEEPDYSHWVLERIADDSADFTVKVHIEIHRDEGKAYDLEFEYRDLCYAVAKACTIALKEYGFYGYHHSTYHDEINISHLLFLKAIALDCPEVRELMFREEGKGEITSFERELELLLFDM